MTGNERRAASAGPNGQQASAERIRLEALTVDYEGVRALDAFSLTVGRGELVTLLGPSGCGKTTALRVVAGFVQPTAGRVFLRGRPADGLPVHQRNIGLVYQSYALFPHLSVGENVAFGLRIRKWPRDRIWTRVDDVLETVRLGAWKNRYPRELSGGMQQRVAVARALAIEPDILLFDEPLSALDARMRIELREEIKQLHRRIPDTGILYVTHDQEEALVISDRIAVMNAGRIVQVGTPESVFREPRTIFCAQFMGAANIIHSRVVSRHNGTAVVSVGRQSVRIPSPAACRDDQQVTFCVRPERVRMGIVESNHLVGTVEDVSFKGAAITVWVAIPGDTPQRIAADVPAGEWRGGPGLGAELALSFHSSDCVLVEP